MGRRLGLVLLVFNTISTAIWLSLLVPSLLLWDRSVPWLVFLSVWALIAAHIGATCASLAVVHAERTHHHVKRHLEDGCTQDGQG